MVNGVFVEDANDDILLDPQPCLPTCFATASFKHRDSRLRRLDKFEGRWFQAEENAPATFDPSKALVPAISLLSINCSTC